MNTRRFASSARTVAAGATLLLALGCGDAAGPPPPAAPAEIVVVAGDAQTGVVGAELAAPLVVRVTDAAGRPTADVIVRFEVTAGAGAVEPHHATTGADGRAEALWRLGTSASAPQRAESRVATGAGAELVAVFAALALPGEAALVTIGASPDRLLVGESIELSASVTDRFGNPIEAAPIAWRSETPAVAAVAEDGVVTGVAAGVATVTASSGAALASISLSVLPRARESLDVRFTLGTPEVVFSYRTDRCDEWDLPDMTARAVRMHDGTIALYSGNAPRAYASFGRGFDSLARSCTPTLVSDDDPTAPTFSNQEWLSTVYRVGAVYHAIVHNEFHDPLHPNCRQGDTSPANPCWYNALTYASSADGRVFTQPPAPAHVLAGPPQRWDPSGPRPPGAYGYFAPSNIVQRDDGYYYAMFFTIPNRDDPQRRGSCVMRTRDLADPRSWRAWDGVGYGLAMPSPYSPEATGVACTIVLPHGVDGSLTYSTYLERYIYVGASGAVVDGTVRCGFLYTLSEDLITWSPVRVLKAAPVSIPPCGGGPNTGREYYPSLIDHDDATINFENTDRTPHLYYTRYNDEGLNRDLLRVPVTLELVAR